MSKLLPCQGCNRDLDPAATTCPGCGRPEPTKKPAAPLPMRLKLVAAVLATVVIAMVASSSSGDPPVPRDPPRAEMTVSITLESLHQRGAKGQKTCTCGFVMDAGSGPDHTVDGTRIPPTRHINLMSHPRPLRDNDPDVQLVMAWWKGGSPTTASYPRKERVCVVGRYEGATIADADVVSSCSF